MRIRDFLSRRSILPSLLSLLLLALILVTLRMKGHQGIAFVDGLLLEVSAPLQKGATLVFKKLQGLWEGYLFLVDVRKENEALKKRLADLQRENDQMREMILSLDRLKRLLQFRETLSATVVAAEIVGRDPTTWFKSLTINKGEKEGIRKGMAVISPEGVVGQVLKVGPSYAVVLLITDYNSAVDSMVQRTRAKAIVGGGGENRCQLRYLLRTEDVVVGDRVVTSGLAGNFPKGMMIGEVCKVDKRGHGIFQYAELVPSVDFSKLEEVLVVQDPSPPIEEKPRKGKKAR
ncbi:MAG: rod shape-determining protein MreC [Desulfobacterota bacterium]|nr:rod shape-determining protein MreC [Thermodesulfobacteriota bacterium]